MKLAQLRQDEKTVEALIREGVAPLAEMLDAAVQRWETSLHGMRMRGLLATPINLDATGNQQISAGPGEWCGYLVATGTSARQVNVYDGHDSLGELLHTIWIPASNTLDTVWPVGVAFSRGLFINVGGGSLNGSILTRAGA